MTTSANYQYLDLSYLNLMTDGDDDMKKVMIDMLFEELPQELDKMQQLCAANNWAELKAVSHKMKSTLTFIGNARMTEANKEVEAILKEGKRQNTIPGLLAILHELHPKVVAELRTEYNKL